MLELLKKHVLLQEIEEGELVKLLPYFQHQFIKDKTKIIEQGQPGQFLYLICSGTVHIQLEKPNIIHIATLEGGAFFGEMSCLTGDPISASVVAKTEVSLLMLDRAGMLHLMEKSSAFQKHMMEAMIERIQQSNKRVAEEYTKNLYFMQRNEWHDRDKYGELIGESEHIKYVRSMINQLQAYNGVISIVGETGVGKTHVAKRIHYLSARQQYPVLTISSTKLNANEWETLIVTAQSGTIIVTDGELLNKEQLTGLIDSSLSKGVQLIIESKSSLPLPIKELLIAPLRERSQDIPLITKKYLSKDTNSEQLISEEALRMLTIFPYLTGNVAELIKVIENGYLFSEGKMIQTSHLRFSSPRIPGSRPKIGLALGSGSLRGISHIGVLRIIEEAGLPIDYIAGTSVGSIVGGAYAAGLKVSEIEQAVSKTKWNDIIGFTFPKRSIAHNEPLVQYVKNYIGDYSIEQLKIPFAAVASDANTGEAFIMREGSLAKAITASTAIPAVIRPVNYNGKTLVDGAVVHPVPAALVKSMGADMVVAVNVCAERFTKGIPRNFIKSLLNTIDMMSAKIVKEELQLADIIIRPETDHIVNGFKDFKSYITAGESAAQGQLASITDKYRLLHD